MMIAIRALNDDSLGLDMKLGEFLFIVGGVVVYGVVVVVVAGIDTDFYLGV
jgi:hypothetical protein